MAIGHRLPNIESKFLVSCTFRGYHEHLEVIKYIYRLSCTFRGYHVHLEFIMYHLISGSFEQSKLDLHEV